jgi:hypothetical protein
MKAKLNLLCALVALVFTRPEPRRRRASAMFDVFNEAPAPEWDQERASVVADIANAKPVDDESEWFQVAPYGEHANRVGLQVFTKEAADKMVASFNSLASRVGRLFRGAPIYAGHPDVDPARWPDSRRLGKIVALEARNDGLYAKAEWNTLGAENNEQGYYVYPSPRWLCEKAAKGISPVELVSVGLTNTPNIRSSAPVTANDEAAGGGAGDQTERSDLANDLEVANAQVTTLTGERDAANAQVAERTTERDALQAQLTAANDALAAERGLRRECILDYAVESGRITPADRPALVALFNSDWAAAEADLKGRKAAYNTQPLNLPKDRGQLADAAARRAAQLEAVNAVMSESGRSYDEAWELIQKDARYSHLFSAANA